MGKQTLHQGDYANATRRVGQATQAVNQVSNGLNTNDQHLQVQHVQQIFHLYQEITALVQSYGQMASHDLQEFNQVAVNIQKTDQEASQ